LLVEQDFFQHSCSSFFARGAGLERRTARPLAGNFSLITEFPIFLFFRHNPGFLERFFLTVCSSFLLPIWFSAFRHVVRVCPFPPARGPPLLFFFQRASFFPFPPSPVCYSLPLVYVDGPTQHFFFFSISSLKCGTSFSGVLMDHLFF